MIELHCSSVLIVILYLYISKGRLDALDLHVGTAKSRDSVVHVYGIRSLSYFFILINRNKTSATKLV